jgi:NAD(P)-dependent dehydrogenase (short-subunit alcohol dehydrogenase family)
LNIENLFSVAGKTVVITGGSSGLGLMMAEGFLKAGARIYISGRKGNQLEEARQTLSAFGDVQAVQCDLGTPEGLTTLVDTLNGREEKLHVLINNAGKSWGAPFSEYPDSAWGQLMTLNVHAPFALSQRLLPLLEKATATEDPARIINIGSIGGIINDDLNAFAYSSSKAAVHRLTQHLAHELAPKKILVNAIAPGMFPSKMSAAIMKDPAWRAKELEGIPLGRFGEPEDIAGLAIYLSARASAFMTGNIIPLDGGTIIG